MKSIKQAVLGALLIVAGATIADAQTHIYFTGSTAYRKPTIQAIHNAFTSGLVYGYVANSGGETGANAAVYSGVIGSATYVIKTTWTGSEAGIQTVSDNGVGQAILYVQDVPTVSGTPTALTSGGLSGIDDPTVPNPAGSYVSQIPDVDLADTYQATSQFKAGASITYVDSSTHTFATLTGATTTGTFGPNNLGAGIVGVVPFNWVASRNADFTNINNEQIKNLYAAGFLPRALLSGTVAGDESIRVYAVGRDPDSGTRLSAFAQSGLGATKGVSQFQPLDGGGVLITATGNTIATLQPWPDETVNNVLVSSPNGGYNSGGKLAGALGSQTSSMVYSGDGKVGGDLVTYLSTGDAATAQGGFAKVLTYDGVAYSLGNVEEGSYPFWSYEHMYFRSSINTTVKAVVNSIATNIHDITATVPLGAMNVTRNGSNKDGAQINPNYSF